MKKFYKILMTIMQVILGCLICFTLVIVLYGKFHKSDKKESSVSYVEKAAVFRLS